MSTPTSTAVTARPSNPGLVRALGPLISTAIVIGTVIGTGVFVKRTASPRVSIRSS